MRAIRRFTVQPVLPAPLTSLIELATNLRWAWHPATQELFAAIDPTLWESTGHDPLALLSRTNPIRFEQLSDDRRYLRHLEVARADLEDYMTSDRWYQGYAAEHDDAPEAIGYFSAEFGISHVLPQYSGGLGILAGDHLKAASDTGTPIIGVGLLYRHGYFRQSLNNAGWQQERYPVLDPHDMPLTQLKDGEKPVVIEVTLGGRPLKAHVWVAQVGRVPLLMMDTGIEENPVDLRGVTDRLYGGGTDHRLAQEVLLGIGGVRALREYCRLTGRAEPTVFHCNEGHAGFLGLERIREYLNAGMDFETAVEHTRAGNVFTTHTPVPAGIDRFPKQMVADQFKDFSPLPLERIMALGAEDYEGGDPDRFNMAVMGFRLGQRANGVSELHGEVSREMFRALWPDFDPSEVPIGSVTNGVHHKTWIHPELMELLQVHTGDGGNVVDGMDWTALDRVDDNTLWSLKRQMRGSMIAMARERLADSYQKRGMNADWVGNALSPHTLTFGFARRAASYKRLTLMLSQPERLKKLLNDPERPIQIVIAGKAHPADDIGKSLIQQMVQFCDSAGVRGKIVFLPDYDMSLAQPLYPGCDVWINNPLRPYEACGTSGMKASLNGAANLSVRDGWWDEWFDSRWGWEIPSAEGIEDPAARDAAEAEAMYEIIEREIIPAFYDRDSMGLPQRWLDIMRNAIQGLGPRLLASRMVKDYVTNLYHPAAVSAAWAGLGVNAKELGEWKKRVRASWDGVAVEHVDSPVEAVSLGGQAHFGATVRLGALRPEDVEVHVVVGDVSSGTDELANVRTYPLTLTSQDGDLFRYDADIAADVPGSIGYTVRVVPSHAGLTNLAEMGLAAIPAV